MMGFHLRAYSCPIFFHESTCDWVHCSERCISVPVVITVSNCAPPGSWHDLQLASHSGFPCAASDGLIVPGNFGGGRLVRNSTTMSRLFVSRYWLRSPSPRAELQATCIQSFPRPSQWLYWPVRTR